VNFLLHTNVVSEWMKPQPNRGVIAWLAQADEDRVFLSVITLAELRYGIERMPHGSRRQRLSEWLEQELPVRFEGRVLDVDPFTADTCGRIIASSEAAGRPSAIMDAFIAATAQVHSCTVVTRNLLHFAQLANEVFNPWS